MSQHVIADYPPEVDEYDDGIVDSFLIRGDNGVSRWVGVGSLEDAEGPLEVISHIPPREENILNASLDFHEADEDTPSLFERIPEHRHISASDSLWVTKYTPNSFSELLSDENVNLELLRWLDQWKKYVCRNDSNVERSALRPECKISMLTGPPGVGKTTLAHIAARHCGFEVIELNASVHRSVSDIGNIIKTTVRDVSTSSTSVGTFGALMRPKCLILDEMDGIVAEAASLLLKVDVHRPVICLANDAFAPSLRELRQTLDFRLPVPPLEGKRLEKRLQYIINFELPVSGRFAGAQHVIAELVRISGGDVRCCLNTLQFICREVQVNGGKDVSSVVEKMKGKDAKLSLWSLWDLVFHRLEKQKYIAQLANSRTSSGGERKPNSYADAAQSRQLAREIAGESDVGFVHVFQQMKNCADPETLLLGIQEHYGTCRFVDGDLLKTSAAIEWLSFTDLVSRMQFSGSPHFLSLAEISGITASRCFASFGSLYRGSRVGFPRTERDQRFRQRNTRAQLDLLIHHVATTKQLLPLATFMRNEAALILDWSSLLGHCLQVPLKVPLGFTGVNSLSTHDQIGFKRMVGILITYGISYVEKRSVFADVNENASKEGGFEKQYGKWGMVPDFETVGYFPTRKRCGGFSVGSGGSLMAWASNSRHRLGFDRNSITKQSVGTGYTGPPRIRDDLKRALVAEVHTAKIRLEAQVKPVKKPPILERKRPREHLTGTPEKVAVPPQAKAKKTILDFFGRSQTTKTEAKKQLSISRTVDFVKYTYYDGATNAVRRPATSHDFFV